MRLVSIKDFDIINSTNISVSVWCGYCPIRCNGCHNSQYWSLDSGVEFQDKHIETILEKLNEYIDKGLSILGGEPLADINIDGVTKLVKATKGKFPNKTIILWTGYDWDMIKNNECIKYIDIIIDGIYDETKVDSTCRFRGSTNQRMIDVKQSLEENKVILYNV